MKILILGADGYLGWPTAMHFAMCSHQVCAVDNYLRRKIAEQTDSQPLFEVDDLQKRAETFKQATGISIQTEIGDCTDYQFLSSLFKTFCPDVVIHYAEQPSAPFSMSGFDEAELTLKNNIMATFNVIWAVIENNPECHIVKLGTMGEYGTPDIDIEEGWIDINHNGRSDRFLYPRHAGSLYHTSKVLDTDLLWFYVRSNDLKVTDLMQGPVYGFETDETKINPGLGTFFHYDDIFGTVLNRFVTQAVAGLPLTIYGEGGQTRGYLNIIDTIQCVKLAVEAPPQKGELRILNQFTEQFTVLELAEKVISAGLTLGLKPTLQHIKNPRKEKDRHYYNARHSGLVELGLQPNLLTEEVIAGMCESVIRYKDKIDKHKIMPRVSW